MQKTIKRYRLFIVMVLVYILLFIFASDLFFGSSTKAFGSLKEMMLVIPPIFVLLGLLDVWVPKETMVKLMGKGSGLKGMGLAFFLGSAAAGPLYGAFPVAITLLKKGSSFTNVLILMGAWSTTKLPMLMFEAASLGIEFTVLRFGLNLIGILGIAFISELVLGHKGEAEILQRIANSEV
jgi:uncharacterized membrane protein YraQ (UPF0718 family)